MLVAIVVCLGLTVAPLVGCTTGPTAGGEKIGRSPHERFPAEARKVLGDRVVEARAETPTTNFVSSVRLAEGEPDPVDAFKLLDAMASLVDTEMPFVTTIRYRSKDNTSFETLYWNPTDEPAFVSIGSLPPRTIRSLIGLDSELAAGARVLGDVPRVDRAFVNEVAAGKRPVPRAEGARKN